MQNLIPDNLDSGFDTDHLLCNTLVIEIDMKVDKINSLNNNGISIEDIKLQDNNLTFNNNNTNISYTMKLPEIAPQPNSFLGSLNSDFDWITLSGSTGISIGITNNIFTFNNENTSKIFDIDNDTKVLVEQTPDDDTIRFISQNQEISNISITGVSVGNLLIHPDGGLKLSTTSVFTNTLLYDDPNVVYKTKSGCLEILTNKPNINYFTLSGNNFHRINRKLYGANIYSVENESENMPCGVFFSHRNNNSLTSSINRLASSGGNDILSMRWNRYEQPEIKKSQNSTGSFSITTNNCYYKIPLNITFTEISDKTFGSALFIINGNLNGVYVLSKYTDTILFSQSTLSGDSNIQFSWNPLEPIKCLTSIPGEYHIQQLFENPFIIFANSNSWTNIPNVPFSKTSMVISIFKKDTGISIYVISKNNANNNISKVKISGSGVLIEIRWNPNSYLQFRCSVGGNYQVHSDNLNIN